MSKIVGVLLAATRARVAHLAGGTLPAQAAAVAPRLIFTQRLDAGPTALFTVFSGS